MTVPRAPSPYGDSPAEPVTLADMRFQSLLEAAPDAMVSVDRAGIVTLVNHQVEILFGYTRKELIGRSVDMLVPAAFRQRHPARRATYAAHPVSRAMGANHAQLSGQRKDGTTFPADISLGSLVIDGAMVITAAVRDVSERIAIQGALAESEANFRQLTESVDVAFVLRALEPPKFLYISPAFMKIYGYDPMAESMTPSDVMQRVHPEDVDRVEREYWRFARNGGSAQTEYRILRADGQLRWVRATTDPVHDADGVVRRSAGTAEDITDRKIAETEMRDAHAEAQTANATKNEFLSRMSHELRTPLNAILGFAQLLQLDELTTDQSDGVQYIMRGGRHLLALIDDVLDITKIETDRLDVSMEPVAVVELVAETIELMRPMAAAMDVTVRYVASGGEGPEHDDHGSYVRADRRRLRQVLFNLLSNAIKYNFRGGSVDITCRAAEGDMLEMVVSDTGRGIKPENLPRLFIPFDRLGAQAMGIEGAGVGLSLSQRLMANMGGSLRVEPQAGAGSTFVARIPTALPVPVPSEGQQGDMGADGRGPATARLTSAPTRLLVYVEDNDSNVSLMRSIVSRRPAWRMVVTGTGAEGLAAVEGERPDLLFLDVHLPDMDGVELLGRLRSDPAADDLPVIAVSADASPRQIGRLLQAGAGEYVTKPVDIKRILMLLDRYEEAPGIHRRR